ncbi:MAG: 1-deoxy-D-xylulose-5-phosphate reductoisomerase [Planctomycetota bacterium]
MNVAVIGSTGSIGTNALEVLRNLGWRISGLAAGSRWEKLAGQIADHRPAMAVVADPKHLDPLRKAVSTNGTTLRAGPEALRDMASAPGTDIVLSAISGAAGLPVSVAALSAGKRLALANKESLVMAGELLLAIASRMKALIIPVDSEHSALFQLLDGRDPGDVERLFITASGGPFRNTPPERLACVTPEEALRHPTWAMGPKITVDSATMMNKALEIIEARWLFGIPAEKIHVLVHPQSIVHALVEFKDGATLAHLGCPDMKIPIQYALTHPRREKGLVKGVRLSDIRTLEFHPPDEERFPALKLGAWAAREEGTLGAVLNAANEVAVEHFLAGRLPFPEITRVVETCMKHHVVRRHPTLDDIRTADTRARQEALACING